VIRVIQHEPPGLGDARAASARRRQLSPAPRHKRWHEQIIAQPDLIDLFEPREIDEARTWCERQERE
jgi:hypothetical protein